MTLNLWYDTEKFQYCIMYNGRIYKRHSKEGAMAFIEESLGDVQGQSLYAN